VLVGGQLLLVDLLSVVDLFRDGDVGPPRTEQLR
jgi:hypothetical protein